MKLVLARVTALQLPLTRPLVTAHGAISTRAGVLLELESEGVRGFGEALPLPGFGLESAQAAEAALAAACERLVGREFESAPEVMTAASQQLAAAPAARAALDSAWRDLCARLAGESLAAQLSAPAGRAPRASVETGILLGAESEDEIQQAAERALKHGFRTLKLKLGAGAFERDLARARALRRAAPDAALRFDANAAWNEHEARIHIDALAALEPELLEQPLAFDAIDGMARLRERAAFPLAADEAVRDLASARRLLAAGAADVLVLKPAALGGPGVALEIAACAAAAGVDVLVTTFLDGAVGRAMALHVAAALAAGPHAAGLATGALLSDDLASSVAPRAGALQIEAHPGHGVTPDSCALQRLAIEAGREFRA